MVVLLRAPLFTVTVIIAVPLPPAAVFNVSNAVLAGLLYCTDGGKIKRGLLELALTLHSCAFVPEPPLMPVSVMV